MIILQPDIIAPGSEILGAWTDVDGPTRNSKGGDMRKTQYNIMSGTSVSTPHVAAAAVLIKAIHPTWSASAIKSALMTTGNSASNHPLYIRADLYTSLLCCIDMCAYVWFCYSLDDR